MGSWQTTSQQRATSGGLSVGSYKSVRFALSLLTSHLGRHPVGDLSLSHGKEVLGYITQLSPNVRKYRDGKEADLADLASLSVASEGITLAPQTQARILKQMSQFLDWCVGEGELGANPWEALKVKDRRLRPMPFLALTPLLPFLPKLLDLAWVVLDISVLVFWVSGW